MVSEVHVAAVRALLARDLEAHASLLRQIDREDAADAYGLFFKATFQQAAWRKFGPRATRADIIRFVGDVRARQPSNAEDLDARIAERLLWGVLGDREALQGLTGEDTALMGPLLLELVGTLTVEEMLLAEAQERLEATVA
ncbi:hypothetical protein [Flindersiella endophytica]